jgi:hypothetical protein
MPGDPPPPVESTGARFVMLGRVALLLAALAAVAGGLLIGRRSAPVPAAADAPYLCPMHREVRAGAPGSCPICGMALERREAAAPGEPPELTPYGVRTVLARAGMREIRAPARADGARVVIALVRRDELAALASDEHGSFEPAGAGTAPVAVERRRDAPRPWDDDTVELSFDLDRGAPNLAPGVAGSVAFAPRRQRIAVVPETALLQAPEGPFLLVASHGDRVFTWRKVSIGRVTLGNVPIVDGVAAGERIATRRISFLEAERRLRDPASRHIEVGR